MPADLDLALAIGKRLEQNASGGNVPTSFHDSPCAEPGIRREVCGVALKALDGLLAIAHGNAGEPPNNLVTAVDVEEPIGLLHPPWTDDEAIRRGQTVVGSRHPQRRRRERSRDRTRDSRPGGRSIRGR